MPEPSEWFAERHPDLWGQVNRTLLELRKRGDRDVVADWIVARWNEGSDAGEE